MSNAFPNDTPVGAEDFQPVTFARATAMLIPEKTAYHKAPTHMAASEFCFEHDAGSRIAVMDRLLQRCAA